MSTNTHEIVEIAPGSFLDKTGQPFTTQIIHDADRPLPGCPVMSVENVTQQTTKNILNARHYKQWVEGRGLDPRWVHANCWSVTASEASELLGYTAQSDGVMIRGANYQVQFRPDKPWLSEKDKAQGKKKAPKYRSPGAAEDGSSYDAILPAHPDNPRYWDDLEKLKELCYKIDGHPWIFP